MVPSDLYYSIEIEGDDDDEEFLSILEKNLLKIHLTPTKPTSSEFLVCNPNSLHVYM